MGGIRAGADRGDIVLGWLTKVVVGLTVVGVLGYDAVSVAVTYMNSADLANQVAAAASESWSANHDLQTAIDAAATSAEESGAEVARTGFRIDDDGTAHVIVRKTATTVLLSRIGPLRRYAVVTAHGSGRLVS